LIINLFIYCLSVINVTNKFLTKVICSSTIVLITYIVAQVSKRSNVIFIKKYCSSNILMHLNMLYFV